MPVSFFTPRKPLTTFSLAGLTDIVLLLLIFFLLTSNFIPQYGIGVDLPRAARTSPLDGKYLTVTLTAEGRYLVNGRETPAADIEQAIAQARKGAEALVLQADARATVGQFAAVASAAQSLGMRVLMATAPADTGDEAP